MIQPAILRLATSDDALAIQKIYRPSVEASNVSFETEVPLADEMRQRIKSCLEDYPWIVDVEKNVVRGYAYAGRYHPRSAYRWAAQVSVYVSSDFFRQGVAARLYRVLFSLLEQQGIRKVLAAIAVPNPASQKFHESLGFQQAGVMPDVGYKLGQWQSMGWWQRSLGDEIEGEPKEMIPFSQLPARPQGNLNF